MNETPLLVFPAPDFEPVTVLTHQYYHHDADLLADGSILALVFTLRHDDATDRDILGDGVVVFDYETGEESWFIDLFDYYDYQLDYCPVCIETNLFGLAYDWTHGNALWFDEEHSHVYISVRNLDRILVVEYPSGDVVREIGDGGETFAHAHDPAYLDDGSILLFDNGLHRPSGAQYSRALQFRENGSELEVLWEYRETPDFFSANMGDVERLPSGDTIVTDGFNGRIVQVEPDGSKVWELQISPEGLAIYKSRRIAKNQFMRWCGQE
jgi:hypothetical protein